MIKNIIVIFLFIFSWKSSYAVNFYDGIHAPDNLYILTYSGYYQSNELTDNKSNSAIDNYGYDQFYELVRIAWYYSSFVITGLISVGGEYVSSVPEGSFGLGDAQPGVGYFLPVKFIDIFPMVFVKFPTGEYEKDKSVNFGSNQIDLKPMIFFNKRIKNFMFDGVVKYYHRFKDTENNIEIADELYIESVIGYRIRKIIFGPSMKWKRNIKKKITGETVEGKNVQKYSLGCDFLFPLNQSNVTFTYLNDIYAENTLKGHFFQLKVVYKAL